MTIAPGVTRYRSIFSPPGVSYDRARLTVAFGTGEREDLFDPGIPLKDENNRFYVVQDLAPTGAAAFPGTKTELDLTDITVVGLDTDPSDSGFFFVLPDGEKFISGVTVFAGQAIVTSYQAKVQPDLCVPTPGEGFVYVFDVASGQGFFEDPLATAADERRYGLGRGLPTEPRVSIGSNPDDDVVMIKTSTGELVTIAAPPRFDPA